MKKRIMSQVQALKKLIALAALLGCASMAQAQQRFILTSLAANTVSNILSAPAIIDNITVINATAGLVLVDFFDSSNTSTTRVQAAYTSYATYATNWSTVFTNSADVLVTNTFSGVYTAPTAVAISTNTRPKVISLPIPANSTINQDVRLQVITGLNAVPNAAVTTVVTYRNPQ